MQKDLAFRNFINYEAELEEVKSYIANLLAALEHIHRYLQVCFNDWN